MPVYNLNMLANQASYLMNNENLSEAEAISRALSAAGISEDLANEKNLQQEISNVMNLDHEQQAQDAEDQLQQQAAGGYQPNILREEEGETSEAEVNMQDASTEGTSTTAAINTGEPTGEDLVTPDPNAE